MHKGIYALWVWVSISLYSLTFSIFYISHQMHYNSQTNVHMPLNWVLNRGEASSIASSQKERTEAAPQFPWMEAIYDNWQVCPGFQPPLLPGKETTTVNLHQSGTVVGSGGKTLPITITGDPSAPRKPYAYGEPRGSLLRERGKE